MAEGDKVVVVERGNFDDFPYIIVQYEDEFIGMNPRGPGVKRWTFHYGKSLLEVQALIANFCREPARLDLLKSKRNPYE